MAESKNNEKVLQWWYEMGQDERQPGVSIIRSEDTYCRRELVFITTALVGMPAMGLVVVVSLGVTVGDLPRRH